MIDGVTTQIKRNKRRKTISFEVIPGSIVRVLVPDNIGDEYLEKVIQNKSSWIHEKVQEANKILLSQKDREFVSGEAFPFLGKEYRLKLVKDLNLPSTISDGRFLVTLPPGVDEEDCSLVIKARILAFYKSQAVVKIQEIVDRFSAKIGVRPNSFDIRDYKKSWGMCTKDKEIFINWRVIMAPISVINYVVVHELCHLIHPNHSKEFWSLVKSQINNVEESKKWLKYNQKAIDL